LELLQRRGDFARRRGVEGKDEVAGHGEKG
jgi:hypothetical protein